MSWLKKLRQNFLSYLRVTDELTVRVYKGFGNSEQVVIYGHVLRLAPLPRKKYRTSFWVNTLALLRLFMVRPVGGATVRLRSQTQDIRFVAEKDGFFRLEWKPEEALAPGWHSVEVDVISTNIDEPLATGTGSFLVPNTTRFACVSDIDDTFLISHSSNLRKRLYVLFTENAYTRDPFEDVVQHYQLLAQAGTTEEHPNPFFYVSSSEWNLYDYIQTFCTRNGIPDGVFLLSQIKGLHEVWKTGQGKHMTKFARIVRILEAFPNKEFILLGDDTQEDPTIYGSLVEHFPNRIHCVYLRRIKPENEARTQDMVTKIKSAGVSCCYFKHSSEAIQHSRSIGLLTHV